MQAEAQKKKDEAEVQVNSYTMEATEAETVKARGQGRWYSVRLHVIHLELVSMEYLSGTSTAILIALTTFEKPTMLVSKQFLLVLCPGLVMLWTSSLVSCG